MEKLLRIGEVATKAGVSPRTVDFYTSLGLIEPAGRTAGNFRLYSPATVDRIALIRQLEAQGVSLDEIAKAFGDKAAPSLSTQLGKLNEDLAALQEAAATSSGDAHGLLAAITARAHNLITTALDIAATLPPPGT
ncbi:hypothetical protein Val02_01250 [Virgisporangium aliadipatigenens]|uniref:HTH merR-type domain-containing protein n=1 Tax=Virgisporangium aliadipatigenens TaxID=741659 RepID=A0A8J4DMC5_9ACTN|nr:MerR family transcriptional regulator [Virgisporangium aliadipatigenens]GIJ43239.1 hypothetical protein Val02_01250 [Virgisporangium aliadipatigenens]